ncbi:methyltransferase domain-containing protein [Aureibacillus halotolerans]|uniref:Methyltransferase family protein n=1 Tax=Aureibacillus halotolerans TaxID=1508390 RepID=A0A4R6UAC9_9BACI|nr:methyltransferase domain-containing protein [Aureibacillus halotolerans]TDQ42822.1 methyltransferase family protein [Aureibacillus halotolerans]
MSKREEQQENIHEEENKANNRAEMPEKTHDIVHKRTLKNDHTRLFELVSPGVSVLDVGCGTGAITKDIALMSGPTGKVVGIDMGAEMIEKAKEEFGHIEGLDFDTGSIYELPYENQFDIVTAARVLQWLDRPEQALKQLVKAVKPGGKIIVLDYQHEQISWNPEPPASMRQFYNAFLQWRKDAGMDNAIADHLPDMFAAAGLHAIDVSVQDEVAHRGDAHFEASVRTWQGVAASRGHQLVNDGFLIEDERALAEREYGEWVDTSAQEMRMVLRAVEGTLV